MAPFFPDTVYKEWHMVMTETVAEVESQIVAVMFVFAYLLVFNALFCSFQLQNAGWTGNCFTCVGTTVKLLCSECT